MIFKVQAHDTHDYSFLQLLFEYEHNKLGCFLLADTLNLVYLYKKLKCRKISIA